MNSKGWIFRNNVASLSEDFFFFSELKKQQIIWYHEIKQIKLTKRKDRFLSSLLVSTAVFLSNVLYFWHPSSGKIQFILALIASASFLVGYWNPFSVVKVEIHYKNQTSADFVINKKKYRKYHEIVKLIQKTIYNNENKLSNQVILHDWSLSAV